MDIHLDLLIALSVISIFFFILERRQAKNAFQKLTLELNASMVNIPSFFQRWYSFEANFKGVHYQFKYSFYKDKMNSSYKPPVLIITIFYPLSVDFSIRKETLDDKINKGLHLAHEVIAGNPEFDKKYFISAHQKEIAKSYLNNALTQWRIDELFNRFNIEEISFSTKGISAKFVNCSLLEISSEFVTNVVSGLASLVGINLL
jgi:hypothetical protein